MFPQSKDLSFDGYVEKEEIPQKRNRFHYRFTDLQVELLDLPEDAYRYDPQVEDRWANGFGYKLLDPPEMGDNTIPSQAQKVPLEPSIAQNSPKSDLGQFSEQAVQIGIEKTTRLRQGSSGQSVSLEAPSASDSSEKLPDTFRDVLQTVSDMLSDASDVRRDASKLLSENVPSEDRMLKEAKRLTLKTGRVSLNDLEKAFPSVPFKEIYQRMEKYAKAEQARTLDWGVWEVR